MAAFVASWKALLHLLVATVPLRGGRPIYRIATLWLRICLGINTKCHHVATWQKCNALVPYLITCHKWLEIATKRSTGLPARQFVLGVGQALFANM